MEIEQHTQTTNELKKKSQEKSKYLWTNDNENTTYPNLRDAMKAVLKRKFTAVNIYIKIDLKSTT